MSDEEIGKHYGDILTELKGNTQKFFYRYPITRNRHQMDECVEELLQTASEMVSEDTSLYRSPGWMNCNFCLFRGPCIAKSSGGNYEALLEHEFNLRTGHESMRSDDEEEDV